MIPRPALGSLATAIVAAGCGEHYTPLANVRIRVRGDGGFGNPTMYAVCERLEMTYTFGLSTNALLERASEALLAASVRLRDEPRQPQRLFAGLWYRAGSWPMSRLAAVGKGK